MNNARLNYINNLRILLICLVVLLHLNITYGAPGSWYYYEAKAGFPEILPMAMFNATNQSFFMGMFFFISAFFIVPSLERKGMGRFLTDRAVRLGIPLLLFVFILNPLTVFICNYFIKGEEPGFFEYLINGWARGFGPMWFVEALIYFTLFYLIIRHFKFNVTIKFPNNMQFILAAVLCGLLQFTTRLWLPVGWSMPFTNFQLPFFVQYILLFSFGIIAYRNNWMDSVTFQLGKRWFIFAQLLVFVGFPLLFIGGGASGGETDVFMGGLHWQSLGYAIWEQLTGFSLIIGLFGLAKQYFNKQGTFTRNLSEAAYGVYVFHTPIIVGIAAVFAGWKIYAPLKFAIVAPVSLIVCFSIAWIIRQIPGLKKIF